MRPWILLLLSFLVLAGCKPEDTPTALRMVHTLVVETKRINQDRHAMPGKPLIQVIRSPTMKKIRSSAKIT